MLQWEINSSAFLLFGLQEATQWDLRSLWSHFPIYLSAGLFVFLFLVLVPVVRILRRTGHNPVWCLLTLVPGLNLLALWFLAFKSWPTDTKSTNAVN